MKEIRLRKLTLHRFQGGTFSLDANGEDVAVFGMNASGKTRLVSAFTFLLFSKDALGRSDFQIKDLNMQGEVAERGIDHSTEAILDVNGELITFKKVYREKWVKTRGRAQAEFSGHSTQHFINSIPKTEKEYKIFIDEMTGGEETFRLLTSPTVFPGLEWKKQRQLLLEVCGNISDVDVIASDETLFPLKALLEKFKSSKTPFEDLRTTISSRRGQINKEFPNIGIRIDEVRRGLPDITSVDREASENEVLRLETALNDAKLRLQGVNTGGNIADLTKKISGLNADLRKMEEAHRSGSLATINRLNQQISEIEAKVNAASRRIDSLNGDLKWKEGGLQTLENIDLPKLREKWMGIDAETFKEPEIPNTCYACGQDLPADQVQAAREKARASFNESKAERLGDVDREGQSLKDQRNRLKAEVGSLREERSKVEGGLPSLKSDLVAAKADLDTLKRSSEDFSGIQNRADLLDETEDLEAQIKSEREGVAQDAERIKEERAHLQGKLTVAKDQVDKFIRREQGERRIEELKVEEKNLSAEFEKLESELYLIELFIKTKVSMLTDRINGKFEVVRFKLFNVLINGGIEDCCEITVGGVPFNAGLNNAARIQAGCDIIRTLQQHFGMRAPVFCDNRESVTDLPEMGCQVISLVVSPEDKTLRVETVEEAAKAGNTEFRSRSSRRSLTLS